MPTYMLTHTPGLTPTSVLAHTPSLTHTSGLTPTSVLAHTPSLTLPRSRNVSHFARLDWT
jgi:hypothetical protein